MRTIWYYIVDANTRELVESVGISLDRAYNQLAMYQWNHPDRQYMITRKWRSL